MNGRTDASAAAVVSTRFFSAPLEKRFTSGGVANDCMHGWLPILFMLFFGAGFGAVNIVLAHLLAFVSVAVIMNSAVMELPSEKDGRFWPFVMGGLAYALLLLPWS